MKFQDLQPDRLSYAKQLIADMVVERPSVPLGLVLVADEAYIQVPPTRNHAILLAALEQVTFAEEMGIADGSALGLGMAAAAGLLVDLPGTNRAVILLTDGTSTDGAIDPYTAAQAAAQSGIQIHTIGLGLPGQAPFPQHGLQGSYTVNWESQVDETVLQEIAEISDASYFRAADLEIQTDLPRLIAASSVNSFATPTSQPRELFALWLGVGLTLLLAEFVMRQSILSMLPEAG
jgi:Ca-activated chloride channel family protein